MNRLNKILGFGTVLTRYEVLSTRLPDAFDGFKILHISDFHCVGKKNVLNLVEGEGTDAVIITGDMADEKHPFEPCAKLLRDLVRLAPVYQIAGNHDVYNESYDEFYIRCRDIGTEFLRDETVEIEKSGERIFLHGIDDPKSKKHSIIDERIKISLEKLKRQEGYEILLFHRANKLDLFKNENFDLILSGHMHGGQIRLPCLGGVLSPKSGFFDSGRLLFPEYSGGQCKIGDTDAIINCGLGNPVPLPRWGNPTEIVSITLRKTEF